MLETGGFGKTPSEVHGLDRLTGGALDQIVDDCQYQHLAAAVAGHGVEMRVVCAHHRREARRLVEHVDKGAVVVGGVEEFHGIVERLIEPHPKSGVDPADDRRRVGQQRARRRRGSTPVAELLLQFDLVTVSPQAVAVEIVGAERVVGRRLGCRARTRRARGRPAHGVRFGTQDRGERPQREHGRGGEAPGHGHPVRSVEARAFDIGETMGEAAQEIGSGVPAIGAFAQVEPVQAKVGGGVHDEFGRTLFDVIKQML